MPPKIDKKRLDKRKLYDRESLRVKVLKRNTFKTCRVNFPAAYWSFLVIHERKREERMSLTVIDKARIKLSRITEEFDSDDRKMKVDDAIDAATTIEQEPERVNLFDYRTLISIFVRKFNFFERKSPMNE
jgi:hypothetical protein